jgi:hypothetical protein
MAKAPGRAGDQSAEPDQQAQVEALGQRGGQDWMPLMSPPGLLGVSVAAPLVRTPHLQIDSEWQRLRRP